MATREVELTSSWTQITDGTQTVQIQVMGGTMWLRDSPTRPSSNAKGHSITAPSWIGVSPPQQMWARATGTATTIMVT